MRQPGDLVPSLPQHRLPGCLLLLLLLLLLLPPPVLPPFLLPLLALLLRRQLLLSFQQLVLFLASVLAVLQALPLQLQIPALPEQLCPCAWLPDSSAGHCPSALSAAHGVLPESLPAAAAEGGLSLSGTCRGDDDDDERPCYATIE